MIYPSLTWKFISYKLSGSNIVHKIEEYMQYFAIMFLYDNIASIALLFTKYCTTFCSIIYLKRNCTNVLLIYCTTLHKILHIIIAVFIAQSIVLYCTRNCFDLHKVLFIILDSFVVCKYVFVYYCTFLFLFCTFLFRFIAHLIPCANVPFVLFYCIYLLCVLHTIALPVYCSCMGSSLISGLCKNSLSMACPAWIPFLVYICQFLSSLVVVPEFHDGSTATAVQTRSSS